MTTDNGQRDTIYIGPSIEYVREIIERNELGELVRVIGAADGHGVAIESGPALDAGTLALCGPLVQKIISALVSEAMLADTFRRMAGAPYPYGPLGEATEPFYGSDADPSASQYGDGI